MVTWKIGPEVKPGLVPKEYFINPAESKDDFELTLVNPAQAHRYILDGEIFPYQVSSAEIANSVINDYVTAQLEIFEDSKPGLFVVPGSPTKNYIAKELSGLLNEYREYHDRWSYNLVKLADDIWQATHRHKAIPKISRESAKYLSLDREWSKEIKGEDTIRCIGCKSFIPADAAICMHCMTINNEEVASKLKRAG